MRAFLFPGQGSQFVGMGTDLFRTDAAFRDLVKIGSDFTGEDLERICLRGPDKLLRRTRLLQPLIVAVSLGYLRHLADRGVQPDIVLGHSLGEISALAAAGVLTHEEAVFMAAKRGALMEEAAAAAPGGMLAVTTSQRDLTLAVISDLPVTLANDNSLNQFVLSGSVDALNQAGHILTSERLGRCQPLSVDGPWHSAQMAPAREAFRVWSASVAFRSPRTQLIMVGSAALESDPVQIKESVTETLAATVRWRECMEALARLKPQRILEIGPGRVLTGLVRANGFSNETQTVCVGDLRGVEAATA